MWASEVERIGFQKCTPRGYRLKIVGGYLFMISVLATVAMFVLGLLALGNDNFRWGQLIWALPIPVLFVLGIVCKTTANTLTLRNEFEYDYTADEAKWNDGQPQQFTHAQWLTETKASRDRI